MITFILGLLLGGLVGYLIASALALGVLADLRRDIMNLEAQMRDTIAEMKVDA